MDLMRALSQLSKAFLDKNFLLLGRLTQSVSSSDADYASAHALQAFAELQHAPSDSGYEKAEAAVRTALKTPPKNVELFVLLLNLQISFDIHANRLADAKRLLAYRKDFISESLPKNLIFFCLSTEWAYHLFTHNYSDQRRTLDQMFEIEHRTGTASWLLAKNHQIESAMLNLDLERASQELETLKNYRHIFPWQGLGPYELMKAWQLSLCGEYESALQILTSFPQERRQNRLAPFLRLEVLLLIKLGKLTEAALLLDKIQKDIHAVATASFAFKTQLTAVDHEILRASLALAQKRFSDARIHSQRAINLTLDYRPYSLEEARLLLFSTEIACLNVRAARVVLQTIDPSEQRFPLEWFRLYRCEKNNDQALAHLKRFLDSKHRKNLKEHLTFAYELSPGDFGSAILEASNLSKKDSAPSPSSIEQKADSQTFLIGESVHIRKVRDQVKKYASSQLPILISGETGTGKEVVAHLLHEQSPNAAKPFVAINCASISEALIESELFGHVKGAFTGAVQDREGLFVAANGGTLFLDEISSMPIHLQASLLRVLEDFEIRPVGGTKTKKVKTRVIAASNEPLDQLIAKNAFRKDLYFRLTRLHVHIPPLRDRLEDIPHLLNHFISQIYGTIDITITDELIRHLQDHSWPGNVRELKNEIERMVTLAGESKILDRALFENRNQYSFELTQPVIPSASTPPLSSPDEVPYFNTTSYRNLRLEKIIQLLQQQRRLTRFDIVRTLGCSPTTACSDLKILQEQQKIRRVITSKHLRTSYFVLS
jgi:DNA-binding NtrC family response regulator